MKSKAITIIIPTWNEEKSITSLVERIDRSLTSHSIKYCIVCVDDRSTDSTQAVILDLAKKYPITLFRKKLNKPRGKAYSLLAGFKLATTDLIGMIDADLQYPPEVLPEMIIEAQTHGVVVANRKVYKSSWHRRVASRLNSFVFGRLLHGLTCDIQSGLKVFHRDILEHLDDSLVGSWSFDIPLLFTARELGHTIGSVDTTFERRKNGDSKIKFLNTAWQIGIGAVRLRLRSRRVYLISPDKPTSMLGAGMAHKKRRYITHTTLHESISAYTTFYRWQAFSIGLLLGVLIMGLVFKPLETAIVIVAVLSTVYFLDVLFNFFLVIKSLRVPPEILVSPNELKALKSEDLPIYTILCPLYKEARVLGQFLEAIGKLNWPKQKLDVIILLEQDDVETIAAAKSLAMPKYVRTLIVPDSQPKTKPKACNYGLSFAKGEYIVIYDAEDKPDPDQLKKSHIAFGKVGRDVVCLQAKLNFYNPHHNLLTRLFTAEYSLWFDVVLTGLQSIGTIIPLGGTSNHFKTQSLRELHGWDAFNVTEDCDLGARIFKKGYKTAIIDSVTLEEATSNVINWFRQRSRWIKGYLQTYLVHMRDPVRLIRDHGVHAFIFQLLVGGKIAFMYINPLLWIATISYFVLHAIVGPTIEALYPTAVFYMAVTSLVFGNFLYVYYYMIGCAKKEHWSIVKYIFLVPFYWLMVSGAAVIALIQLIFKPHYWEKTHHGYHILPEDMLKTKNVQTALSGEVHTDRLKRLRQFAFSDVAGVGVLVVATAAASVLNFLYNAYLGRNVSLETFGKITLFGSFFYIVNIPLGALGRTITHRSAYLLGKYTFPLKAFWRQWQKPLLKVSIFATGVWYIATPFISRYFHLDIFSLVLFSPVWILGTAVALNSGFLSGSQRFRLLALLTVVDAVLKLVVAVILVQIGRTDLIYGSIPASLVITALLGALIIWVTRETNVPVDEQVIKYFPKKFFGVSIVNSLSSVAFLTADVLMVNHYLSPTDAGHYGILSLVGKIIFIVGSFFGQFIMPIVSREVGAGRNGKKQFYTLLFMTCIVTTAGFLGLGVFGYITVPILFGKTIPTVISLLPVYTFAMVCFTIASSIISFHQIRREYIYALVGFTLSIVQVVGIVLFHESLHSVVNIMVLSAVGSLLTIGVLHLLHEQIRVSIVNILDFFGLFSKFTSQPVTKNKLRVLIYNWRDTKHAWAGGAEVYVHEIARRWVKEGNSVTVFCGNDGNTPRNQVVDGVQVVRRGGFFTVYLWACLYYVFRFRGNFDVVIDSENGVPFFTPAYVRVPIFLLIHHVHQEVFRNHLRFPFAQIAMFIESKCMPLSYRKKPIITISESSKKEIIALDLSDDEHIAIVHPGVDIEKPAKVRKTSYPLFSYVGRLKAYKQIDTAIHAFARFQKTHRTAKFVIAGEGESMGPLKKLAVELGISGSITFLGRVGEREKIQLLSRSWVVLQPSSIEGWGITVIEANACGTPVIASNSLGLRDSVVHEKTGLLVQSNNVLALTSAMERVIHKAGYRKILSQNALEWSQHYSWDRSADKMRQIIINELPQAGQALFSYSITGRTTT